MTLPLTRTPSLDADGCEQTISILKSKVDDLDQILNLTIDQHPRHRARSIHDQN